MSVYKLYDILTNAYMVYNGSSREHAARTRRRYSSELAYVRWELSYDLTKNLYALHAFIRNII